MPKTQNSMRAIRIREPGGPEVLQAVSLPVPEPGPDELLIRVAAAGVNRPDVFQRLGLYPPPPGAPETPGLEVAGTIAAVGRNVTGWRTGEGVCAVVSGGGYAEYCVAPAGQVLPIPDSLDMTQAAALPETFFTVWSNVWMRAGLKSGESLLVHGGTSGIGTSAIMMASALGQPVFATAGSAEKCAVCLRLGAVAAINYQKEDFVDRLKTITGGRGIDVILDMVGGDYFQRNIDLLASEGRLVNIAFLKGAVARIDFRRLMLKRLTITGSTLRARSAAFKATVADALRQRVWPLIDSGAIVPVIDSTFPLSAADDAHRRIGDAAHIGKIVLVTDL